MRPGQSNKRSRGRGRKGPSPLSRSYESNGPDVKIRGTAQHIADKYINLARDAQSSGDTVLHQAYMQHAEHFYRIVALAQQQMNQPINVRRADDPIDTSDSDDDDNDRDNFDPSDPDAPQPEMRGQNQGQGNGRDRDRGGDDDDRRGRRNRGRNRRGRDDFRDENRAAPENANGSANGSTDDGAKPTNEASAQPSADAADSAPAANGQNANAAPQESETSERPRRTRSKKASVDVTDRFSDEGGADANQPAPAASEANGGDAASAPVQAASDES